jgi:hypothetical protein
MAWIGFQVLADAVLKGISDPAGNAKPRRMLLCISICHDFSRLVKS